MEEFKNLTVKKAVLEVNNNNYCLPIIQRDYVWEPKKIELLFDSIMRYYPIGTFLFWRLNDEILDKIKFFSFCKYGSENKQLADEKHKIEGKIKNNITGVLDGQQRLTSLYIGMCGEYKFIKKGVKIDPNDNTISKVLCLDLTSEGNSSEEEFLNVTKKLYNFEFKTEEEIKADKKWFKVSNVLIKNSNKINTILDEINEQYPNKKRIIKKNYNLLVKRLTKDDVIHCISLKNEKLSDVLEIFERVNSFGKSLKKTDLLFSIIVSNWPDGREEMNNLLKYINTRPNLYNKFDISYIVLSSLVMIGESPKIRVSSLDHNKIETIKKEWSNISKGIKKTVDLISKINMFPQSLRSINAFIPINYFCWSIDNPKFRNLEPYKKDIKKYLELSIIKKLYGVHADTVLVDLINAIKDKKIKTWNIKELYNIEIDNDNRFRVTESDIDELLEKEKSESSLFTLSVLYEGKFHINNDDSYEQDHMHPRKPFINNIEINFPNKTDRERNNLIKLNNKVANLQLLTKTENENKSDMPLKDYIEKKNKKIQYLPDCSYDVIDFETFYEERKKLIKATLMNRYNVKKEKDKKVR